MRTSKYRTAEQVFQAFPRLSRALAAAPTDDPPDAFAARLAAAQRPDDAIQFCAHWLGRREAVHWGTNALRFLAPELSADDLDRLGLAEAWVADPVEERRVAALKAGIEAPDDSLGRWMALAAGASGGSMTPDWDGAYPAPPDLTGQAVAAGLIIALSRVHHGSRERKIKTLVDAAIAFAETGELRVPAPEEAR